VKEEGGMEDDKDIEIRKLKAAVKKQQEKLAEHDLLLTKLAEALKPK
jgi:hypothetical protein